MHGLINRAIQRFVTDSYGEAKWLAVTKRANLEFTEFEAMWIYKDAITSDVLSAVCDVLYRSDEELLEDIGTYLVSDPNIAAIRRLLRFGGLNFVEFLHSLDDLPDRARLAVSDLHLPRVELTENSQTSYSLRCYDDLYGWGYVFMGVLRAMSDDYGALAFLEHKGRDSDAEIVEISLLEQEFSADRGFDLGVRSA